MERALVLAGGGARGAFQIGVWKYLNEIGWKPDLICGSSVGAINAAAIASGMPLEKIESLWKGSYLRYAFPMTLPQFIASFFSFHKLNPLFDTSPMQSILNDHLNIDALRHSDIQVTITAVNMRTAQLTYFNNEAITIDHIMASSAMPIFFPWHIINGDPFWDGGVMANMPIKPAIDARAKTILMVFLSPIGVLDQPLPQTHFDALEIFIEHCLLSGCNDILATAGWWQNDPKSGIREGLIDHSRILAVSPSKRLGLPSILNFSSWQAKELIEAGYMGAKQQLEGKL